MNRSFTRILLACVFTLAFGAAALANDTGCTLATVNGDYGFRMSGEIFAPTGTIQRDEIAMIKFDGTGHFSLLLFATNNGIVANSFDTVLPGTYAMNSNCTGNAEIDIPPQAGGQVVKLMFVLSKHATIMHALVFAVIPPGFTKPIPAAVHGDGEKLGSVLGSGLEVRPVDNP